MNTETAEIRPVPTTKEIGDALWIYHQDGDEHEVLSLLIDAGKLEASIELMKLVKLDKIYGCVEEIQLRLDRAQI
jgi:hypothetical protein